MEFSEVIRRRHSCRRYEDRPVEREKLRACLEAGRLSPSGCNTQRWVFVAVDEPALLTEVAEACKWPELNINLWTDQVPAFIVIVQHPPRRLNPAQARIIQSGDFFPVDVGCAAQSICLAATDQGLGSVMVGHFDQERVRRALGYPQDQQAVLIIGVGYPKQADGRRPSRYPAEEICRWNGYAKQEPGGDPQ